MRRLILMRHAEAERSSGLGDFARELTEAGRLDAALVGRALARAGWAPDLAVVSSAKRAMQTWEAAAPAFPDAPVEYARDIYETSAAGLAQLAHEAEGRAGTLLLIGHNPSLYLYASQLAGGSRGAAELRDGLPPSAAALFEFEGGRPRFERLLKAKDLGGG
ncbi:MAG TPA: histidine phosphatase family protein [Caulobacteraceae bacterium]|jgi:phosphohistidine phosphatase